MGYEIINLGGGNNPISIARMINSFEQLLGKKAIIDEHSFYKSDMLHTWANIEKAKQLLDWEPTIDFETGLQNTVDWY